MSDGAWEAVDGLIEVVSKSDVCESERKLVDRLVEKRTKREVGHVFGEMVDLLIEAVAKSQVSDAGLNLIERLVEARSKS